MVCQVEMAFFWQMSDIEWERLFGKRWNSVDFAKIPSAAYMIFIFIYIFFIYFKRLFGKRWNSVDFAKIPSAAYMIFIFIYIFFIYFKRLFGKRWNSVDFAKIPSVASKSIIQPCYCRLLTYKIFIRYINTNYK